MALLRLLNVQGIAGLVVGLALTVLLVAQKGETRHWKKQSAQFEQLYRAEQSALAQTVAGYRAAAEQARAADKANAERVAAEQRQINERTKDDYQARLDDARARAERLRRQLAEAAADSRGGRAAPVPGVPSPAIRAAEAAGEGRLSSSDQLTATEQAIQLDELIKWVKRTAGVNVNGKP